MLQIINIDKKFASQTALSNINLQIAEGEFFSLLGPSGCGKSTLLRIIAGLDSPTSGRLIWRDRDVTDLPAQKRPFNMVFQKYALFPHMSVAQNLAFGLQMKGKSKSFIEGKVIEILNLVGLSDFIHRKPETLSGGQAQRVAIARALVNEPEVLLLDEPLSALDQQLREHLQTELRSLQKKLGITFVFVTHDQEEALLMSDRIGVMNHGHLEQVSTPEALYFEPQTDFTSSFVGQMNQLKGEVIHIEADLAHIRLQTDLVIKAQLSHGQSIHIGSQMNALVRPEKIKVLAE